MKRSSERRSLARVIPSTHMIRGVMQHMAYHAGQIALIRKLVEAPGTGPAS